MFNRIIVPTDGSDAAWRAVVVGERLAERCGAELEFLHIVVDPADATRVNRLIEFQLEAARIFSEPPIVTLPRQHTIARTIASHVESVNGGALVMSSAGHGRTAALLGSIATDVLVESFGPVVVVGPHVKIDRPVGGELLVAVDGSEASESALALAGSWGIGLRARPWIVSVADPGVSTGGDTFDSAYPSRLAHHLESMTGHPVEFESLHGHHPAQAIADFAESIDASLIFASTHGRTGLARLAHGSVAAALVRHARCPVVLMRPPSLPAPSRRGVARTGSMT